MGKIIVTEQELRNIISNAILEAIDDSDDLLSSAQDFLYQAGTDAMKYCRNLRKFANALGVQLTPETIDVLETAAYIYMRD